MTATPEQIDLWRQAPSEHQRLEFKEARQQFDSRIDRRVRSSARRRFRTSSLQPRNCSIPSASGWTSRR